MPVFSPTATEPNLAATTTTTVVEPATSTVSMI
jgi:hypothetical protein